MGYAKYVGRVGALAVVLGVGSAVSQGAAVAWAGPADGGSTNSSSTSPAAADPSTGTAPGGTETASVAGTDAPAPAPGAAEPGGDSTGGTGSLSTPDAGSSQQPTTGSTGTTTDLGSGVVVSSSGGAHTSTKTGDAAPKKRAKASPPAATASSNPPLAASAKVAAQSAGGSTTQQIAAPHATSSRAVTSAPVASTQSLGATPAPTPAAAVQAVAASVVAAPATVVSGVAHALAGLFGGGSDAPVESPLSWVVAAIARRQTGTAAVTAQGLSATTPQSTSQTFTGAAATGPNLPPVFGDPVLGTPDPVTGAVSGTVTATDPENKKVSYAVTEAPADGTLVFNKKTGAFTYTPTAAQRVLSQVDPTQHQVTLTVTATTGRRATSPR